jgi:hypothetical protein
MGLIITIIALSLMFVVFATIAIMSVIKWHNDLSDFNIEISEEEIWNNLIS